MSAKARTATAESRPLGFPRMAAIIANGLEGRCLRSRDKGAAVGLF
jgi:hypothetical protein